MRAIIKIQQIMDLLLILICSCNDETEDGEE